MLFFGKRKSAPLVQSSTEDWRKQWQDLVPPECRNVPVTVDGKTMTAYGADQPLRDDAAGRAFDAAGLF